MTGHSTDISGTAGIGRAGFVSEHALYSDEQRACAVEVIARIQELGLKTVRVVIVDQHGSPRAKFLSPQAAAAAFANGVDFSGAIYSLDTGITCFHRLSRQAADSASRSSPGSRTSSSCPTH